MRPFALTMQSQRLDVQRLALALLVGATLMGLAWGAFAVAGRARPTERPGQCVDMGDPRMSEGPARSDESPDPRCPADDLPYPPVLREGTVVFVGAKERAITVELAELRWEQSRGLMYRTHLPEDRGMLFKYPRRAEHTMWMQGTCIALDVLFVDEDGTIVGIREDVGPLEGSPIATGCPSRFVIEVNAGFCRRHGVRPGQKVRLPGVENVPVRTTVEARE